MTGWSDADRRLAMAERAAIMEIDGGLPRDEAERQARHIMDGMLAADTPPPESAPSRAPAQQLGFEAADEGFKEWKDRMQRLVGRW